MIARALRSIAAGEALGASRGAWPGRCRRGAVAVQAAISLVPMLGVVALAIDGGTLFENRRRVQASADAAALAASSDLLNKYATNTGVDKTGTGKTAALANASGNGYANDTTNSVVTVNIPPTVSTTYAGKAGYAEVVVQYNQPRGFSAIIGSGTIPVRARAVARGSVAAGGASKAGLLLLDPTGSGALNGSGGGNLLKVVNAGVVLNSSSASAINVSGSVTLEADSGFSVSGTPGLVKSGTAGLLKGTATTTPTTNVAATLDPLSSLVPPTLASLATPTVPTLGNGVNTGTYSPGRYPTGISIAQSYTVTLLPGFYYLQSGGFNIQGSATVTGTGVTIYNAPSSNSDQINIANSANVTLSPPTSGAYQGLTMWQAKGTTINPQIILAGYGRLNISGTVYAPSATLNVSNGTVGSAVGSQIIAYDAIFAGYGQLTISYDSTKVAGGAGASVFGIVE